MYMYVYMYIYICIRAQRHPSPPWVVSDFQDVHPFPPCGGGRLEYACRCIHMLHMNICIFSPVFSSVLNHFIYMYMCVCICVCVYTQATVSLSARARSIFSPVFSPVLNLFKKDSAQKKSVEGVNFLSLHSSHYNVFLSVNRTISS